MEEQLFADSELVAGGLGAVEELVPHGGLVELSQDDLLVDDEGVQAGEDSSDQVAPLTDLDGDTQAQLLLYPGHSFHFEHALESEDLQSWAVEFEVDCPHREQQSVLEVVGEAEVQEEAKDQVVIQVQL